MRMLVTGGAGFIGTNFIKYWLKKHPDDTIINLDVLTYAGNSQNLAALTSNPRYKFIKGDICNAFLVKEILTAEKIDLIVNFAAESHVDRSIVDSKQFIQTNVEGTRVLLSMATKVGGLRFHHISTDEVYGSLSLTDKPFNETSPYRPRSPYSASKAAADHLVMAFFHTYKLPVTISNCSNNFGPYQHPEKLFPLAITNALSGKKIPLYGKGENIRDWIYVYDHCAGIEAVIKKGKIGETYCLGGGSEMSNIAVIKHILDYLNMGEEMIEFVKDRPGHDFRYAIDYTKAKQDLGWEPKTEFKEGLGQTIEWYNENKDWWIKK